MTKFRIGDVVELNSGGPQMTVEKVDGDQITCTWFVDSKADHRTFPESVLKKVLRWMTQFIYSAIKGAIRRLAIKGGSPREVRSN
jgi:uncharacterized protein YodC (DUF2158 family)